MSNDLHHEMMLALRAAEICLKNAAEIQLKNRDQSVKEIRALEFVRLVIAMGEAHNNAVSLPNNAGEGEV
jgi:hypothetical protein